jgi:YfiH family protein
VAGSWVATLAGGVQVRAAGRSAGDFADQGSPAAARNRRAMADMPWTWLKQVHGARVVVVGSPGDRRDEEADAAVTVSERAALAVTTADCAPVVLASPQGVLAVAHAGWRGLLAGVVGSTVTVMERLGATDVVAALGPCIHAHAYAFSRPDLEAVVARFGPGVAALDDCGRPALDLPAAVRAALAGEGAVLTAEAGTCTHCSPGHWSWRARRDAGRQATVAWRAPL